MNDLITRTETWTVTTVSAPCSAELWRRLKGSDLPFFEDVAELAKSAVAVVEMRQALPALASALAPAPRPEIVRELAELKLLYGLGERRTDKEWASIWSRYADALAHVPLAALRAGIAEYVAKPSSDRFPMPGPLKALCDPYFTPVLHALAKARRVVALADAEKDRLASQAETLRMTDQGERDTRKVNAVKNILAEVGNSFSGMPPAAPRPSPRSPASPGDATATAATPH